MPVTPQSIAAEHSAISSSLEYDSDPKAWTDSKPSRPSLLLWPVECVSSWKNVEEYSSLERNKPMGGIPTTSLLGAYHALSDCSSVGRFGIPATIRSQSSIGLLVRASCKAEAGRLMPSVCDRLNTLE